MTTLQLAAGIDIGGTNTAFGLVDRDGAMHGEGVIRTGDFPDLDAFADELHRGITALMEKAGDSTLAGVGMGAPNASYRRGVIDHAPNLPWKGVAPVQKTMERLFPAVPVVLTNDANAAAVGEMVYGGARGMRDFIVITLGTGLGSGFVANGCLIHGHDGMAGELGHVTVNGTGGGRMCGCGRRGCLETYVSATGIKRTIFKLLADHTERSEFRDVTYNDLTAEMITRAALRGDPLAVEAFEYTGQMLGRALANAVAVTSPEAIFLLGGLARAGKHIFEPTHKYMEQHLLRTFRGHVRLLPSELEGRNAAVLGAAALVWEKLRVDS